MLLIRILASFCAVVCFAILLEIPKKLVIYAGFTGLVGFGVNIFVEKSMDSVVGETLIVAMVIALLSHIFARILKSPVSVFFVAGVLPIVPGGSIYRCVYHMIHDKTFLANYYFVETIQISSAIALAIFITDSIFRVRWKMPSSKKL